MGFAVPPPLLDHAALGHQGHLGVGLADVENRDRIHAPMLARILGQMDFLIISTYDILISRDKNGTYPRLYRPRLCATAAWHSRRRHREPGAGDASGGVSGAE